MKELLSQLTLITVFMAFATVRTVGVGLVLAKTGTAFSVVAGVAYLGYVLEPIAQGETGEMVSIVRNTNLYPQ